MRAVLFDIDGTLVDSNEFHVRAWHHAFDTAGCEVTPAVIRKHIGMGADMLIPALLPNSGKSLRRQIAHIHDETFSGEYLSQVRPFANATNLIRVLVEDKRCSLMLASSAKETEVEHYIELLGIKAWLTGSTSADDVEHSKPEGDIFAAAMAKLHDVRPHEALVVGDTPYDVIAAAKCEIPAIAVLSGGFSAEQLREAGALAIYADVSDLFVNLERSLICQPCSRLPR